MTKELVITLADLISKAIGAVCCGLVALFVWDKFQSFSCLIPAFGFAILWSTFMHDLMYTKWSEI